MDTFTSVPSALLRALCVRFAAARVTSSADWYNTPGLIGLLAGRIGAQDVAVQVVFNPSWCLPARGRRDEQVGFGRRRAGPHLLDRVQRRGVGGTGQVVMQNPTGGEERGEMPHAGAVQQLFVFDRDHPSRWKSCCERPTPLKYSRLWIFRKENADYEKA